MAHKVLVFESDAAFASELRSELGKLDCVVDVVDDGNAGLQQASSNKPDLILLSIELPRMNGFSVCNKVKKDPLLKDIPLIIMSTESSEETFEQHKKLRTRAEEYLHKPIAFADLKRRIAGYIGLDTGEAGAPAGDQEAPDSSGIMIEDEIVIEDDAERRSSLPPRIKSVAPAPSDGGRPQVTAPAPPIDISPDDMLSSLERRSAAPLPPAAPASPHVFTNDAPAAPVDDGRLIALEGELGRTRDELTQAKDELGNAAKEVEDLRAQLAKKPAAGGVSSREFLDLREALNKKDKEILTFKEGVAKKDREIVEGRDKLLELERSASDAADKLLAAERALADAKEKVEELAADKEQAKKLADDNKRRFERSQEEVEARRKELEAIGKANEQALSTLRTEHEALLAKERDGHRAAMEEAETKRAAEEAAAKSKLEAEETAAKSKLEAAETAAKSKLEAAETAHAAATTSLTEKHDTATKEAKEAAETLLAETTAKLTTGREEALAEQKKTFEDARDAAEKDFTEKRTSLEGEIAQKNRTIDERTQEVASAKAEHEAARTSMLGSIDETKKKLEETEKTLADTSANLAETTKAKDDTRTMLDEATARFEREIAESQAQTATEKRAKEDLQRDKDALHARIRELEGAVVDTQKKLAQEADAKAKAIAKWEADKSSLERAKDALAVVLSQIEEAEARAIS